jgi:hypothetical protein
MLLDEFVMLFLAISAVPLSNRKDEVDWRWTPNGHYTVASTYHCQFQGAMGFFLATDIWKAQIEPKCNFFA